DQSVRHNGFTFVSPLAELLTGPLLEPRPRAHDMPVRAGPGPNRTRRRDASTRERPSLLGGAVRLARGNAVACTGVALDREAAGLPVAGRLRPGVNSMSCGLL